MIATGTAIALAAAAGAGTAVYGANKAAKSQAEATAANKASVDDTNKLNYQRWLESQGVGPDGKPVNTWLPRYFNMQPIGTPRRFKKAGTAIQAAPATVPSDTGISSFAP